MTNPEAAGRNAPVPKTYPKVAVTYSEATFGFVKVAARFPEVPREYSRPTLKYSEATREYFLSTSEYSGAIRQFVAAAWGVILVAGTFSATSFLYYEAPQTLLPARWEKV